MAQNNGPKISNDNLIINLDAANIASYPGTGTVWYNLGTIGGSVSQGGTYMPTFTTLANVTCFNFTQVGSYFINNSIFSTTRPTNKTTITIDVWIYPAASEISSGDRGNICRANNGNAWYMSWNKSSQTMSNYFYGKIPEGYHESGAAVTRSTWNNFVAAWDGHQLRQFTNNTKTTATTVGSQANQTSGLQIGWEADSRQFAGGIASIKIWDAALSDDEINRNYALQKGRFGR